VLAGGGAYGFVPMPRMLPVKIRRVGAACAEPGPELHLDFHSGDGRSATLAVKGSYPVPWLVAPTFRPSALLHALIA